MKTFIKYSSYILGLSLLVIFSSCSDFLDLESKTSIEESEAYSTPAKILAQVNNLYGQIQNPIFYGGRYIVFNEQRGDEFGQNDGNAATGSAVWQQNVATTNEYINNVWAAAYAAINSANILIERLNNSSIISDSLEKHYIAEAKFIRGLCYLSLVQTYAKPFNQEKTALGVPLRLTAVTSSGHNDLVRSTVEEVYAQIIKDLNEAEADLPTSYSSAALNTSRAHKSTAIALKTRVYLNMADYTNVVIEASKIVPASAPYVYTAGNASHKLESNFSSLWSGSYTGAEAILSIPFLNSTTETPPNQFSLAFNYVGQPIIFLATKGIVSDPAFASSSDARAGMIGTNSANQKILRKFTITTAPFRDYVPVMRYAEILLNYAEAAAQVGDINTSVNLLKAVRNRSNASFVFDDTQINSSTVLVNTILNERRIELLGEGFRLQDLQRRVQTLPSKVGAIGTAPEVLPTAKNYIWPIPSGELSTNALCKPN